MIPYTTTTDGQPLVYYPLAMVILLAMLKDLLEDLKRHKLDAAENNSYVKCLNYTDRKFVMKQWKHINLGDIVKVK